MNQRGLTLVELLVVVAIMGILSFVTISFTSAWADSNRVLDAENLVKRAFSFAEAASLRNGSGVSGSDPAAVICNQNNELSVRVPSSDPDPSTGIISTEVSCSIGTVLWHNSIHKRLTITDNGSSFVCACLNNRGRVQPGCGTCSSGPTYLITSGADSESITLY